MNASTFTSIFFLGVFTAGLLTDMKIDWDSWFYGVATAVSVLKLLLPLLKE